MKNSNGCDCIFCRQKEFGISYAMYLYSEIMNNARICINLVKNGIKQGSLGDKDLSGYLSCSRYYCDENIEILYGDEEYIKQLEDWKLLGKLNDIISKYNQLWKNT